MLSVRRDPISFSHFPMSLVPPQTNRRSGRDSLGREALSRGRPNHMSRAQDVMTNLLAFADIRINGARPWDIPVHDQRFLNRVMASGTLGFGESYMDGWWDCDTLDE